MEPDGLPEIDFELIGPPAGARLPDLVLPDQRGQRVDLHAARAGRPALLVVHRSAQW